MTRTEKIQFLDVLTHEFTYRHNAFWRIIYNTSYIIVALYSVPLLFNNSIDKNFWFYFPLTGILFALAAFNILGKEFKLLMFVENKMNSIKDEISKGTSNRSAGDNEKLAQNIRRYWFWMMLVLGLFEYYYITVVLSQ